MKQLQQKSLLRLFSKKVTQVSKLTTKITDKINHSVKKLVFGDFFLRIKISWTMENDKPVINIKNLLLTFVLYM